MDQLDALVILVSRDSSPFDLSLVLTLDADCALSRVAQDPIEEAQAVFN